MSQLQQPRPKQTRTKRWTPARDAILSARWPDLTRTAASIAAEVNQVDTEVALVTKEMCCWRSQQLHLPSRPRGGGRAGPPPKGDEPMGYLLAEAERRGLTLYALTRKLMAVIDRDRMVNAILDDLDEVPVPRGRGGAPADSSTPAVVPAGRPAPHRVAQPPARHLPQSSMVLRQGQRAPLVVPRADNNLDLRTDRSGGQMARRGDALRTLAEAAANTAKLPVPGEGDRG